MRTALLLLLVALIGCNDTTDSASDAGPDAAADGDADADTDGDADTDTDADADTDADGDTDTETEPDCYEEDLFDPADCPPYSPGDTGVRYVDIGAVASGDGLTWETAFATVQEGADAATCVALETNEAQVWIAEGTYRIYQGCKTDTVFLRQGVSLYGGFGGTESSPDERDLEAHATTLTGCVNDDVYWGSISHVITALGENVIDGVHITCGNANECDYWLEDSAYQGGGVFAANGPLQIRNSNFQNNRAFCTDLMYDEYPEDSVCGHVDMGAGGAIFFAGEGSLEIEGCSFANNYSVAGGAIATTGPVSISASSFLQNTGRGTVLDEGCGPKNYVQQDAVGRGGAVMAGSSITTDQCLFSECWSQHGGAVFITTTGAFSNTVFEYNSADGVLMSEWSNDQDVSGALGGSLHTYSGTMDIENCVFVGNDAPLGGAICLGNTGHAEVVGSVFFGNTSTLPVDWETEIWSDWQDEPGSHSVVYTRSIGTATLANSIIFRNSSDVGTDLIETSTIINSDIEGGWVGLGNIDADPLFVNTETDAGPIDLHLQPGSPCIDAANGNLASELDLDNNPRADDPDTPNTGTGNPEYADMGAYEYQPDP